MIKPRKPWRSTEEVVELATAEWVHWFNHSRLYEYRGDIPPIDNTRNQPPAEFSDHKVSRLARAALGEGVSKDV